MIERGRINGRGPCVWAPTWAFRAVLCTLAIAATGTAQQVIVPPPKPTPEPLPVFAPPPETTPVDTNLVGPPESGPPPVAATPPRHPFEWGPVTFHPQLNYEFLYGTGIQSDPGQQRNTIIHRVAPDLRFDLGERWRLDYAPTATFYSDSNFRDTVSHGINLVGGTTYEDWTFGLSQSCTLSSDPIVETGQQTDEQRYVTTLSGICHINSDNSLEFGLMQDLHFASGYTYVVPGYTNAEDGIYVPPYTNSAGSDSRDWSTLNWFNHRWGPNLGTALGVGAGYTQVEDANNMTYEQVLGRITWGVGRKLELSASGGAEFRQFLDTSSVPPAPDTINPIYGVSLNYQPFEATALSLRANQSVGSSFYANQTAENTTFSAGLTQRLLGRLRFVLTGGYTHTRYRESSQRPAGGAATNRKDDYGYIRVALSMAILRRGSASVYYAHSQNTSSASPFGFSSDQFGAQVGYTY
jgi:hypothetical protein